jgi:N-acetylmuramoyl-L-alanine amidase
LRSQLQSIALLLIFLGLSTAAEEKRLSIYSPQTNFSVAVIDHGGQEYVSVTDLIDPFGTVTLTRHDDRWKLRLARNRENTDAEFKDGNDAATIRGKKVKLLYPFWTDGQRGYVPLRSATTLMTQFLGLSSTLRENSRRLFVGDVGTTYSAETSKGNPNRLVLHFSAPVNPTISTEPGHVRLRFSREPVIAGGANPQTFDSPTIRSQTFSENNGAAEVNIATTTSAQAGFSDGRKTITITAVPLVSTQPPVQIEPPAIVTTPGAQPPPTAAAASGTAQGTVPGGSVPPTPPDFLVIVDPAHGGDDPGATLSNGLFEKDVTLAIARRIRFELEQRGIASLLLRDADNTLTTDQRAVNANLSRAALYICVHATSFGTGVRLYSARLGTVPKDTNGGFLPWDTAQAAFLDASHTLVASVISQLQTRQIRSVPLESGLRPLRNIAKPAMAVEVAAPENTNDTVTYAPYQQAIAAAIASGVTNARPSLEPVR